MIIELLGAPSAGKTTLARSLTGRLRDRQIPIELWLSYRPAELSNRAATGSTIRRRGPSTVLRRIARPAFEMLNAARNPLENPSDAALSGKLMRILKPRNLLWSLRMRQYMQRLSYAWLRAARSSDIVLFDQGFGQAICSLAVVAAEQSEWRIERALREVPAADLVVRLRVDDEIIAQRLRARALGQSWIERLLEFDVDANLRVARLVDTVQDALSRLERPLLAFDAQDYNALERALAMLEHAVIDMYQNRQAKELRSVSERGRIAAGSFR